MCKKTTGAFSQMVGYSTAFSGVITGEFAYATYSCQFNNKKDEIMFDLSMILVAGATTVGTLISCITYQFDIDIVKRVGKLDDYYGVEYTMKPNADGHYSQRTVALHSSHNGHPWHWQINKINPWTGRRSPHLRWNIFFKNLNK